MAEPAPAGPVAGSDVGGTGTQFKYARVTLTTVGQVRTFTGDNSCNLAASTTAGRQTLRSHVIIGPLLK